MRFIPRFDAFHGSVWTCLLVLTLWVAAPVCAEETSDISGSIAAVDVIGRIIEVDGVRYTLAQQAEIHNASSEDATRAAVMNMTDLNIGDYVEFTVSGNVIQSLRVFKNGPPK